MDAFVALMAALEPGSVQGHTDLLSLAARLGSEAVKALSPHIDALESHDRSVRFKRHSCAVQQVVHQGGPPELLKLVLDLSPSIHGCRRTTCDGCKGGFRPPMYNAAEYGAADLIPLLLEDDGSIPERFEGPNDDAPDYDEDNDDDFNPIRLALEGGHHDALRLLARAKNAPLEETFQSLDHVTATHHALETGRLKAALILIDAGASVGPAAVKLIQTLPESAEKTALVMTVFARM
jgi:hypothetical protein